MASPTNYIPELLYSQAPVVSQEREEYFRNLEQMRQEYLWGIVSIPNPNVVRASIMEMERVKREIESRGKVDEFIDKSVTDTINYLRTILGNAAETEKASKSEEWGNSGNAQSAQNEVDVIRGVKGLAHMLNCGITKAQAIINSKVLMKTKPAIQYDAGGWRFHKQRLQEYIDSNPKAFSTIKCPH